MLFCFSDFLVTLGINTPYYYLPQLAQERGISADSASFLIDMIYVSLPFGLILSGILIDLPGSSALVVTFIGLGN